MNIVSLVSGMVYALIHTLNLIERNRGMTKMTNEKAIETIKVAISEVEWNYPMDYVVAFEKAIEALEKQIPKKPNRSKDKWYGNIILTSIPPKYYWDCPNCESMIGWNKQHEYCPVCGQVIDWSDEDE